MFTSIEVQDKKVENNQEQVQDQKEQHNSEQTQPQVNEKPIIVIKPLPVESVAEEIPLIPQLVPVRVESEVEQISPNDDLGYMSAEDDPIPMPEESLVEYLPLDAEVEEEVDGEYEEDKFQMEPDIVDIPFEAEGDEFPVETEDVDLPFAPDFESPTESEEEDLSFDLGVVPLPPQVYDDYESDLGDTEEKGGIIYGYPPMEDPDSDVPVDADVEEPYESFESLEEDDTMTDENIPPGFFSWVLPGFFGDEELSEEVPPGAETPIVEDSVEYEVEEEFSPEVSEDEMLEEDTYPDTVDALVVDLDDSVLSQEEDTMLDEVIPSELEPFMIDEEVGSEEEDMDELPLDEEIPYEEGEDVYFPPTEDYMYDEPEEEVYPLDGEMLLAEDEMPQEEGFFMYEDFGLEENLPEHDYYNPTEMKIFEDMPEGPHNPYILVDEPDAFSEFHPIIFPTPGLRDERDESPKDEPILLENKPVADDTPVLIDQPPRTLQIFSSSPAPGRIPLSDILFPFLNMNNKDREDGIIMMEREETSGSPQYGMHIMVLGSPQDLDDARVPVMPITGESMIPQGRPFPIAEFPDQDFHHMDHPSNWTPDDDDDDDDSNNNKPSYLPLSSNPNNFQMFDQFHDNFPQSSFYESEVRPQHWTQSRNRFVSNMGSHFPAHDNMQHHHQPPRFMDSATPFMADISHPNDFGVNFNDDYGSYEPPMKFKKKFDATSFQPNVNGFNSFKPSYSEVFGFPHSQDHGPISPPRSFSSSQQYHGLGPFRQHYHNPDSHPQKPFMYPSTPFRTPQSDFNVFQPSGGLQYRPEQDIYLSGHQSPLDPYTSFYQSSSHHNPRPAPFTSFSRSRSQLGNTHPIEMTLYPEREPYYDTPFNSRPQFPFLPFPVEQQSFNGDTTPAYYDRSHSLSQQGYHASPLYYSNHPNARYAPGYP